MIRARRSKLADATIGRLIVRAVRRNFHALYVRGSANLASLDMARPLVGCANHTNWWDGFVLYTLARARLRSREFFLAMEEKNLARYFFFPWLGTFGVGLDGAGDAVAGTRYAIRLLRERPNRQVWLFVQGELSAPDRPIAARRGAIFLARHTNASLLPVVLRYEWLHESKATIFVSIGESLPPSTSPDELAGKMNLLVADLRTAIADSTRTGFEAILSPRLSLNKRWDFARHVATGGDDKFERENR